MKTTNDFKHCDVCNQLFCVKFKQVYRDTCSFECQVTYSNTILEIKDLLEIIKENSKV